MDRLDVMAPPGGQLAVWPKGNGPPLVLVHGSMADHRALDRFAAALSPSFSTFAMDRRGFGASPDRVDYSADREFGDVAAVVEAVAARAGEQVVLFGHSWGASCALGAACLTRSVSHLVLYEPSLGLSYPPGYVDRLQAVIDIGDYEAAVIAVLTDLVGMSGDELAAARSSPNWPSQLVTAPTIAREARIEESWIHQPGEFDAINAPTLFLAGTETPHDLAAVTRLCAASVRGSRIHQLTGHGHFAHDADPSGLAAIVYDFVRSTTEAGTEAT